MFVIDVTQEANGSQAKTAPQCDVCRAIPSHKIVHRPLNQFVSFRRLTKAPLVSLNVQLLAPPIFVLYISPSSSPFSLIPCPVPSTCLPMKEAQNFAHL